MLTKHGYIYGMGSNQRCELGLGSSQTRQNFYNPVRLTQLESHRVTKIVAGGFSAALTDKNQLIVWGTGEFGVFSTPKKVCMADVCFIDMAISPQENACSAAIDSKGGLYMWGPNQHGQLGQGDFQARILPSHVLQLKRKNVRTISLGHNFALALGKDVSEEEIAVKKAQKAARKHHSKLVTPSNNSQISGRRHNSFENPAARRPQTTTYPRAHALGQSIEKENNDHNTGGLNL